MILSNANIHIGSTVYGTAYGFLLIKCLNLNVLCKCSNMHGYETHCVMEAEMLSPYRKRANNK